MRIRKDHKKPKVALEQYLNHLTLSEDRTEQMVTFQEYRKLALALEGVTEQPHFDNPSFRFKNKIFGTYWTKDNKAMLKLSLVDQSIFCAYDSSMFYPVNGTWGKQGATFVNLDKVRKDMFKDAVRCAYGYVKGKS